MTVQDVRLERTEARGGIARVTGYADFDAPANAEQAMNLVKVSCHEPLGASVPACMHAL